MRLFGVPGGTEEQARSTYWFTPPFDLAFATPEVVPQIGSPAVFDFGEVQMPGGVFAFANPNAVFVAPPQQVAGGDRAYRRGDPGREFSVVVGPAAQKGPAPLSLLVEAPPGVVGFDDGAPPKPGPRQLGVRGSPTATQAVNGTVLPEGE